MQEHFSFEIPRSIFVGNFMKYAISLFIAAAIVYTTIGFKNIVMSVLCLLILALLFYILLDSFMLTHSGLSTASTTYPVPPHLGLDGISLENTISGLPSDYILSR
jgi:hypothetical protein